MKMIKLYGSPISNYYSTVNSALYEKNIAFEAVLHPPSREEAYLTKSSMGKIPCIETEHGFLAETHPILDYLEDIQPNPALLPRDPFARAKVRELVQSIELYVELVARRGYGALFGKEVPEAVKERMKTDLPKGIAALKRLVKFTPWIAGAQFTYADLSGYWAFYAASRSAQMNAGIDIFAQIPGSKEWFDKVAERPAVKKALAEHVAARNN
jgi:glutathione S-transferase